MALLRLGARGRAHLSRFPLFEAITYTAHRNKPSGGQMLGREVGGLLLPGAPRTALIAYAATASAMLSLAPVIRPDNGGTMPSKRWVFTARVEPISPPHPGHQGNWWRRRVPPPGPQRLFHAPFITIAGKPADGI